MVGRKLGQNTSRFRNRQRLAENTLKGLKPRTDKWDCLKLKSFYTVKEIIKRKRQLIEWEEILLVIHLTCQIPQTINEPMK